MTNPPPPPLRMAGWCFAALAPIILVPFSLHADVTCRHSIQTKVNGKSRSKQPTITMQYWKGNRELVVSDHEGSLLDAEKGTVTRIRFKTKRPTRS